MCFAQERGKLSGIVTTETGDPLPEANIFLKGTLYKVKTDAEGKFMIDEIYPGKYSAFVCKAGFQSKWKKDIIIKSKWENTIEIKLNQDLINNGNGKITGKITDEQGELIPEADFAIGESFEPKGKNIFYADKIVLKKRIGSFFEKGGNFEINNVPAGRYGAMIFKKGYKQKMITSFYIESGKTTEINVKLDEIITDAKKFGKITGSIKHNDEPIPGANIYLNGTTLGAASDIEGNFVIQEIPPGRYLLKVSMLGFKNYDEQVNITPDASKNLNISLELEKWAKKKTELDILEERTYELRNIYFTMENEEERKKIENELRKTLKKIFEKKEKKYDAEIEQLKKRIQTLEKLQKNRAKDKNKIIERRIKALLTIY